jgi:hypothetical protein
LLNARNNYRGLKIQERNSEARESTAFIESLFISEGGIASSLKVVPYKPILDK